MAAWDVWSLNIPEMTKITLNLAKKCFRFVCPYHGWTYSTNGRLIKAKRLKGIEDFKAKNFGLKPIQVKQWGPAVLINFDQVMQEFRETCINCGP